MKRILEFLYEFVFIDQQTKQLSHTKTFSVLGLAILCVIFPLSVFVYGSKLGVEYWFAFGIIVVGNRIAKSYFNNKTK